MATTTLNSDTIGVVAAFLNPADQGKLLHINHTWRRGVIEQDGMRLKPGVPWDWDAICQRLPKGLKVHTKGSDLDLWKLSRVGVSSTLGTSVTSLNMVDCAEVTDGGLAHISVLTNLKTLNIEGCQGLTSISLIETVATLTNLTSLNIASGREVVHNYLHGDAIAKAAAQLVCLTSINMRGCSFTDADVEQILSTRLSALDLSCTTITDAGLAHLPDTLLSLNLRCCKKYTDAGLSHMATNLVNLTTLDISSFSDQVTNSGLQCITKLSTNLTTLIINADLSLSSINDVGLQYVGELANLTSLDVSRSIEITDAGVAHICKLEKLISLNISSCSKIKHAGLQNIINSPLATNLTHLEVMRCRRLISDFTLKTICNKIVNLRTLNIKWCLDVTNHGLEALPNLGHLTTFEKGGCFMISADGNELIAETLAKNAKLQ